MTAQEINNLIDKYNSTETQRSWIKDQSLIKYDNEYVSVIRVDSSNKWIGYDKMTKMWSIIIEIRKSFTYLPNYKALQNFLNLKITPVNRGRLVGHYGIRIYDMKKDPDYQIIRAILDFIFS